MKVETTYQCEVCGEKYKTEAAALKCESQGFADHGKWKPGLLWKYTFHASPNKSGIFALAKVETSRYSKHYVDGFFWACRNWITGNEGGDGFDNIHCSGPDLRKDFNSGITAADLKLPEMARMLSYLKSKGIVPYIMIDGVIYPLEKAREL